MKNSLRSLLVIAVFAVSGTIAFAQVTPEKPTPRKEKQPQKEMRSKGMEKAESVAAVITNSEMHSTLTTALQQAGLVEALSQKGEFTVFAPTNTAFEAIPEDKLSKLMIAENKKKLTSVLTYHVIPGTYDAASLSAKLSENDGKFEAKTLQGAMILFKQGDDGKIYIKDGYGNKASITAVDYPSDNGVVHFIDSVVMPKVEKQADDKM